MGDMESASRQLFAKLCSANPFRLVLLVTSLSLACLVSGCAAYVATELAVAGVRAISERSQSSSPTNTSAEPLNSTPNVNDNDLAAKPTKAESAAVWYWREPIRPGVLPSAENNYNGEMGFTNAPADATRDVSVMCDDKGGLASGPSFMLESQGMKYFSYRCKGPSYAVNLAETVITAPFLSNCILKDAANCGRNVAALDLSAKGVNARAMGNGGLSSTAASDASSAAAAAGSDASRAAAPKATPNESTQMLVQTQLDEERHKLAEERSKLEAEKAQREQAKLASRISIQVAATTPDADGDFVISIQTSADTASLKIDDEEQGSNKTGSYTIRRVARVGAANTITISAKDIYGNTDTKTISVARQAVDSRPTFARLNPANIKPQPARDAVAIIIGIQNYKLIPKAEYANQDAQVFYDYASRALGIKQENIKLLLDDEADVSGILTAFQNWLPLKVRKGKTDVYVFYSGHGLPSPDGKSLFFLPVGANKDFVAKTAISQQEIVAGLKAAQPKSVTMFIDSCYSGQIRTGETLLASARPVVLTVQETAYPPDFTVITASASDQIASSSPDLKHGIFSYYLMKGLEGEADDKGDGIITIGKLQSYLAERVPRFAMTMSRKQEPQLTGDANRVLVAR